MKTIILSYLAVILGISGLILLTSCSTAYFLDELLDINMRSEVIAFKRLF